MNRWWLAFFCLLLSASGYAHTTGGAIERSHFNTAVEARTACVTSMIAHEESGWPFCELEHLSLDFDPEFANRCGESGGQTLLYHHSQPQIHKFFFCKGGCPEGQSWDEVTQQCKVVPSLDERQKQKNNGKDCGKGNPCDPATGNKYQSENDIRGGEASLTLTRSYNSQFTANLGFGFGWTSTLSSKRLELLDATTIQIRQGSGRGEPFSKDAAGVWQGDADTQLVLTQDTTGFTLSNRNGSSERYKTSGDLLSETDANAQVTSFSYDANNRVARVTGPFGHVLTYAYTAAGNVSTVTDPSGSIYAYSYDANNNLVRVTYPDASAKLYHYENASFPHHLTGISYDDGAGTITRFGTYAYDATGKAISTEHAVTENVTAQERFTLAYDSETQTTVTDPVGVQERLIFATQLGVKNLTAQLNVGDNKSLTQTFDAQNNLTCKQDEEGRVRTYIYNATNQKTSTTEGLAGDCTTPVTTSATRTTSFQYLSPTVSLPTLTTTPSVAAGQVKSTTLTYADAAHPTLPTQITQSGFTPAGIAVARTIAMSYNAAGQVISIDGPRTDVSDVTAIAYNECSSGDGCGQLASVTDALGQTTIYNSYDANGRLAQMTDANGVVTGSSYDPRGRVIGLTVTPPAGQGSARLTQYSYDHIGQVTQAILPDGVTLDYTYDAAQYLRSITDNLGNKIEYGYDLKGNRTTEQTLDPAGTLVRSLETAYDIRNRVAQINAAGSLTQQLRDAVGNLVEVTDPNQSAAVTPLTTIHDYDALNRLLQTVDNLSGVTAYAYDVNDRLAQVTAPNNAATQFSYDDLGNLLSETSTDRGTLTYTHDAAGNVTTITDARAIPVAYTYDALNRVTAIAYPNPAENIALSYDSGMTCTFGIGRVCQVSDESGVAQFAYDAFGNVTEQLKTELGIPYITRYGYDAGNRIVSLTYPDGRLVSYTRDAVGRISAVSTTDALGTSNVANNITYRADGLVTAQTFGNGLSETRTYDLQGRLTQQTRGLEVITYAYDLNGNVTATTQLLGPSTFSYDALDRLTDETITGLPYQLSYDANGNRLSALAPGHAIALGYDASSNRLAGLTVDGIPEALSLDAVGNLVSLRNGQATFAYNASGRLGQVTYLGAPLAAYTYNHTGLRTRKVSPAGTLVYHYDLNGQLLMETTSAGVPLRTYLWLENTPLAQIDLTPAGPSLLYLHTDHLNTPRAASNATGTTVWRWAGEAFGSTTPLEDLDGDGMATTINLRFPGQYFDEETGFHYNWNRYYDPRLGRYISSDPIGLKGGINPYLYASANPMRFVDPTGLLTCTYSITGHTLACENNLGQTMMTSGVKAGKGDCQDNPACRDKKNEGPLPPGYYPIFPAGAAPNHPGWLLLGSPKGGSNPSSRSGFFIHPWGVSNGCISIYLNSDMNLLKKWAAQDGGGDLFVRE